MTTRHTERIGDLLLRQVEHVGKLLRRRGTLVLLLETGERLVYLIEGPHLVERQTHDARLLGEGLQDRLAYPPHGIGDELETARFIELLRSLDEPQVAFIDKVGKAEPLVLVLFGHRNHETQVGLRQLFKRLLVALLDALRKLHFLLNGDKVFLAYLLQVFVQRCTFAVRDGFCNL